MTLRLSNLFEDQMKKIFKRTSSRLGRSARSRNTKARQATSSHSMTNGGPSTSRQYTRVRRHSSDEDEEIDVVILNESKAPFSLPFLLFKIKTLMIFIYIFIV